LRVRRLVGGTGNAGQTRGAEGKSETSAIE
jgi:hypothetical protein